MLLTESKLLTYIKKKKLGSKSSTHKLKGITNNKLLENTTLLEYAFQYKHLDIVNYLLHYKPCKNYYLTDEVFCSCIMYISQYGYSVDTFTALTKFNKNAEQIITYNINIIIDNCIIFINIPLFNHILVNEYTVNYNYNELINNLFKDNYIDFFIYLEKERKSVYVNSFIINLKKSIKNFIDKTFYTWENNNLITPLLNKNISKELFLFLLELFIKDVKGEENIINKLTDYYFKKNINFNTLYLIFQYIKIQYNNATSKLLKVNIESIYKDYVISITSFDTNDIWNKTLNSNYKYFNFVKKILLEGETIFGAEFMKVLVESMDINNLVSKKNSLKLIKLMYNYNPNIFNKSDNYEFSPLLDVCKYGDYNTYLFVKKNTEEKYYTGGYYYTKPEHIINMALLNCDTRILKDTLNSTNIKIINNNLNLCVNDSLYESLNLIIKNNDKKLNEKLEYLNTYFPIQNIPYIISLLILLPSNKFYKIINKYSIIIRLYSGIHLKAKAYDYNYSSLSYCHYIINDTYFEYILNNITKQKDLNEKYISLDSFLQIKLRHSCINNKLKFMDKILDLLKDVESFNIDYYEYFAIYLFEYIASIITNCMNYKKCNHCGSLKTCLQNNLDFYKTKIKFNNFISNINKNNYFCMSSTFYEYIFNNEEIINTLFKNGLFGIFDMLILNNIIYYKYNCVLKVKLIDLLKSPSYQRYKKIYLFFNTKARKYNLNLKKTHTKTFIHTLEYVTFSPKFNNIEMNMGSKNIPVHANPNNILKLIESNNLYITEKADGITNKFNIYQYYPYIEYNKLQCNQVWSEKVTVNGTQINFVYGDFEFINKLRKVHPYIAHARDISFGIDDFRKIKINSIFNINDCDDYIYSEKDFLYTFIEQNRDKNNLWWPKLVWKLDKEYFIDNYKSIKNMENNIFNTDGWIVFDKDIKNILKIKPDKHLTLDLQYYNSNFYSKENILITNVNTDGFKNGIKDGIYRCYYNYINKNWIPKELRPEKKNANPFNVVNELNNYFEHPWDSNIALIKSFCNTNYYQHYNNSSKSFKSSFNEVDKLLKQYNKKNCNVLDIGCGFKCLKYKSLIKNSNYYGIDKDSKLNPFYSNKYIDNFNFHLLDFSKDWNKQIELLNYKQLNSTSFDVFLIINSIHNCYKTINKFIDELTRRANKKCICIIRFLDIDKLKKSLNNKKYLTKESNYVRLINDNEIKYYHSNYHSEPIIEYVFKKEELLKPFQESSWNFITCIEHDIDINRDEEWENYLDSFSTIVLEYN